MVLVLNMYSIIQYKQTREEKSRYYFFYNFNYKELFGNNIVIQLFANL